jgi:phenylacetate-coenzyme A ligase PaaK-like adenylate-forming protein
MSRLYRTSTQKSDAKLILDEMHELVGSQTNIQIELVKEIPRTAESKLKLVISKVPVQFKNPI